MYKRLKKGVEWEVGSTLGGYSFISLKIHYTGDQGYDFSGALCAITRTGGVRSHKKNKGWRPESIANPPTSRFAIDKNRSLTYCLLCRF